MLNEGSLTDPKLAAVLKPRVQRGEPLFQANDDNAGDDIKRETGDNDCLVKDLRTANTHVFAVQKTNRMPQAKTREAYNQAVVAERFQHIEHWRQTSGAKQHAITTGDEE